MSFNNVARGYPKTRGLNIYTDGSKQGQQTGAGVVIMDGDRVLFDNQAQNERTYTYHLDRKTTVFQSEVFAQKMAANLIINGSVGANAWVSKDRDITINTDNQASMFALQNIWIKSLLVQQTIDLLDQAAEHCKSLTIRWVKAHKGHLGNELADDAAVSGRDDLVTPDWETPLLAKAVMHKEIDDMGKRLWEKDWDEYIGCRQTRHFFPKGQRSKFSKDIINLPRIVVGQLIQILTGHTYLKRHQAIIDESERQRTLEALFWDNADEDGNAIIDAADPICGRCHKGEETPLHLLSECDRLAELRVAIFGRDDLVGPGEIPDFSEFKVYQIVSFFKEAKFETLTMHPFLAQYLPTDLAGNKEDLCMKAEREEGFKTGEKWTSKYLFHIPIRRVHRKQKPKDSNEGIPEELEEEEKEENEPQRTQKF